MSIQFHPQLILHNGRIFTNDPMQPVAQSLAIYNDRIAAAGEEEAILELAGPSTQIADLDGRTVLPGLTDAHIHLEALARSRGIVNCETQSLSECLENVRDRALAAGSNEWVLGHGWNQNTWGRFGTARELDAIAPQNPVFLTAKSLHAAWVNSHALSAAGIEAQTPDPPGGEIQRDAKGIPTGILFETATELVRALIPRPSVEELAADFNLVQRDLWRLGLTGVHDFDGARCLKALQLLRARGELGLRVIKNIPRRYLDQAVELGLSTGFGDHWIRIGNIKVFADGALGPRTAAMFSPYEGEADNTGISLIDSEELLELSIKANENGLGMSVHAIGDRANHEVLNAFDTLRTFERNNGLTPLRHRVEHLQLLHPQDIHRPAQLKVIASMQPIHATSDMEMARDYWGKRSRLSYAWRTQIQSGARLAFGSDAPVESPNPFLGIHAAVTRRRKDGSPSPEGWIPEERITLQQALEGYTLGPAYAAGLEESLGRLSHGYLADLIVLDRDIFAADPQDLVEVVPVGTLVGGVWRYRAFDTG